MNCDWNLRLRGLGGEDNNVLMEGDRALANNACARTSCEGRRGTACTARSNLVKGRMVLSSKNLATLLRNILPVHQIKIMAFFIVPRILLLPSLILLDIQFRLLPNSRLICIKAGHNVLAIGQSLPWVGATAPKTVGSFRLAIRASGVTPTISSDRLYATLAFAWPWEGRNCSPPHCLTRTMSLMLFRSFSALMRAFSMLTRIDRCCSPTCVRVCP